MSFSNQGTLPERDVEPQAEQREVTAAGDVTVAGR